MRAIELKYSKSRIDKAGELLKKKSLSDDEIKTSLEIISNWRAYHAMPLDTFAKVLRERVQKVCQNPNAMVVQRDTPKCCGLALAQATPCKAFSGFCTNTPSL